MAYIKKNSRCLSVIMTRTDKDDILELRTSGVALSEANAQKYLDSELDYWLRKGYYLLSDANIIRTSYSYNYDNVYVLTNDKDTVVIKMQISALAE